MTPFQLAKQRQQDRQASPPAVPVPVRARPLDESILGILEQYQAAVDAAISAMAPMTAMSAERTAYKRHVLPQILPFVNAYIDSGERYPNSVAVQCMIWLFDVGDIELALSLGLALIVQGCHTLPRRFDRKDLETFVCDAMYDWAKAQLAADASASPRLEQLIAAMESGKWSLHPAVASKMYAMAAKHADRLGDSRKVVRLCEAAQRVNPDGAGVKTLLNAAKAKLAAGLNS